MRFGVKSDRGLVREINEDSYNIIAGYTGVPVSFIIADGMGGHNSGEVASRMAVDFISNCILQYPGMLSQEESVLKSLEDIIKKSNAAVYTRSREEQANSGMGTTLTMAIVFNKKVYIGHVGDSRAYLLRDGKIERLTTDHSYIEELIRNGSLTREEAATHPGRNIITRALGCAYDIEVDTYVCDLKENDIFILCTDGLTNMVDEERIKETAGSSEDPEIACEELVSLANANGGHDNITVIVFKTDNNSSGSQ